MSGHATITQAASEYIKKMLDKESGTGLRVSVKKTGCSGYSYLPTIVSEVNPTDIVIKEHGVTIFLDQAWMDLLDGVHIDYIEENKSGLKQKRLILSNEKESGRCGCGESFHIE